MNNVGITGPHDISRGFDEVATGFHLKEWTYTDLTHAWSMLVGVEAIWTDAPLVGVLARYVDRSALMLHSPLLPKVFLERVLERLPNGKVRRFLGRALGVTGVYVVIRKERIELKK